MLDSTRPLASSRSEQILIAKRAEIIERWVNRVSHEMNQAPSLDRIALVNHIPNLIDCIAQAFAVASVARVKDQCENFGEEHGLDRANSSNYNAEEIVQEYSIFSEVVCETLEEENEMTINNFKIIQGVICIALKESMAAYSGMQASVRDRFIATLTHDLRGPIGIAKTASELVLNDCHNPEEVCFLAQRSIANLQRADDLLQNLLDFAYKHSGMALKYQMEACELKTLVSEIVQSLSITLGDRFVVLGSKVDGYWNKSALHRSVENLLINAIKYGAYDKPVLIEICPKGKDLVEIRVHNEGRPIPAEDQKKIFQPFRREKSMLESTPGWGLGLCFVQTAVDAHRGQIKLSSNESSGTDFRILLPVDARH